MPEMPRPLLFNHSGGRRIGYALDEEPIRDIREGERRLLAFILPPFQRMSVWTPEQKLSLIESIWENLPVGSYVVNRPKIMGNYEHTDWLLDGQQRWTAIKEYVEDGFEVNEAVWSELRDDQRRDFRSRTIAQVETGFTTDAECLRIYNKLAYGGTPHEPQQDFTP